MIHERLGLQALLSWVVDKLKKFKGPVRTLSIRQAQTLPHDCSYIVHSMSLLYWSFHLKHRRNECQFYLVWMTW